MACSESKVFFLIRELNIGGAQRQLVELASGLRRAGWQPVVATFYSGGELEAELKRADVRVVQLNKRSRWDVVSFVWRLVRVIRQERPDIVHGYMDVANLLLVVVARFVRRPYVVWGVRSSNMQDSVYDLTWTITSGLSRWLSRFADLIICNSIAGRLFHLARGYSAERTVVIPNGIDVLRFKPDEQARAAVRSEWRVDPTSRLVGFVARLDPMKDHATFLNAAARVAASDTRARFVCVGDGPRQYRNELVKMANSLGLKDVLIWAGSRTDTERVYNALDVSVCASSFGEGFSNAIAEAMATGVPCVVTDVGDAAAIVHTFGNVCAPKDSGALTDAIIEVLARPSSNATESRKFIVERYSSGALCERTAIQLKSLMSPADDVHAGVTP